MSYGWRAIDLQRADRLAHAAKWIAEKLDDDGCRAQSLRATGHVRFIGGRYKEALEHYDAAVKLFRRVGREVDVARTLNGALQSLISLGRYEEALASAAEARLIFERHGVALGLARLDSNVANILGRQDRFDEALALYRPRVRAARRERRTAGRGGRAEQHGGLLHQPQRFREGAGDLPRGADVLREPRDAAARRAGRLQHRLPLLPAR